MLMNFFKGIIIGIANVLPGVSGGTLAVVLNIYDKLTEAVGNFLTVPMVKKIEYAKFLSQIGAGAGVGIVAFAGIISKVYEI
ncbi:MAG: undecaprenyl phosphate translocase family protein, partial [Cetobacterium sp.]